MAQIRWARVSFRVMFGGGVGVVVVVATMGTLNGGALVLSVVVVLLLLVVVSQAFVVFGRFTFLGQRLAMWPC